MLRRSRSRSQQRRPLGRSKSTNSIVQRPRHSFETIDPIVADRDAHIAATLSFNRALGSSKMDSAAMHREGRPTNHHTNSPNRGYGMARSDSLMSREDGETGTSNLKRQQSIRFAGPSANPRRVIGSRASKTNMLAPLRGETTDDIQEAQKRGGPSPMSTGKVLDPNSVTGRYLRSLEPPEEYYTPEDDIASMPSSYRRLRKSKSMFTSSNEHNVDHTLNNSNTGRPPHRWPSSSRFASLNRETEYTDDRKRLRTPKSTNFLRSHCAEANDRTSSRAENDLAVRLAKDKFREQLEQQQHLKPQPSLFFRSKYRRNEGSSGFRKSLRNSSSNSAGLTSAMSSNSLHVAKYGSLRNKARRVSSSVKSKLKGLFSRTNSLSASSNLEPKPECESDRGSCNRHAVSPAAEEASMLRVTSRVPSLHAVPSLQQMRSCQGSVESLVADEQQATDDKSRVTSWTDSVSNTVPDMVTTSDWERQRLSVIKENGLHVSSSSLNRPPNRGEPDATPLRLAPAVAIDSQRVYSALMKRLKASRLVDGETGSENTTNEHPSICELPESASIDQLSSRTRSPPTIRCVQQEDDVFHDNPTPRWKTHRSSLDSIVSDKQTFITSASPRLCTISARTEAQPGQILLPSLNSSSSVGSRLDKGNKHFAERSSAFFASPTSHLFRTASPFRRALRDNMKQSQDTSACDDGTYLVSLSNVSLPMRKASTAGTPNRGWDTDADSIYSSDNRNAKGSDDRGPPALMESFPQPPTMHGHGHATIFVDQGTQGRQVSTASSVEWKTWLSANVSKREKSTDSEDTHRCGQGRKMLAKTGHVREEAEIESPGEGSRAQTFSALAETTGPLMPLQPNSRSNSAQRITQKQGIDTSPLGSENRAPSAQDSHRLDTPTAPPLPTRNRLRVAPSLTSTDFTAATSVVSKAATLPPMRSLESLARCSPSLRQERARKRRAQVHLLRGTGPSTQSSPDFPSTREKSCKIVTNASPSARPTSDMSVNPDFDMIQPSIDTGRLADPDIDVQAMGSKQMVDLFLSSRRRRIHGSRSGTGSDGSPAAFL